MCDSGSETGDELTALREAAQRLRARSSRPSEGAAIGKELVDLRHVIDLLELEFARLADKFEESGHWDSTGSSSPQDWIRHNCRVSATTAYAAVNVGALAAELAESTVAVADGRIGFAHLTMIARTARAVARDSGGYRSFDETSLLPLAEAHSVGRFYYDCTHARHADDPVGALFQHTDAVERRYLELNRFGEDFVVINGMLDTVGAATLRTALEPLARRNGAEDKRFRSRRLADALVELSSHVLDQGSLPQRASQRPHLQVSATLETLQGAARASAGEMEFGGAVPGATVQRMACDATVFRVLLDAESAVIDVGRARRTAPPATLRALRARDGGCVWPGCDRSASWTTAHHVAEWVAHKGGTDASTMVLLCYRHHWRVHEGGWQIARTDEGVITVPPIAGYAPWYVPDSRPPRVALRDWQAEHDERRELSGAGAPPGA